MLLFPLSLIYWKCIRSIIYHTNLLQSFCYSRILKTNNQSDFIVEGQNGVSRGKYDGIIYNSTCLCNLFVSKLFGGCASWDLLGINHSIIIYHYESVRSVENTLLIISPWIIDPSFSLKMSSSKFKLKGYDSWFILFCEHFLQLLTKVFISQKINVTTLSKNQWHMLKFDFLMWIFYINPATNGFTMVLNTKIFITYHLPL